MKTSIPEWQKGPTHPRFAYFRMWCTGATDNKKKEIGELF